MFKFDVPGSDNVFLSLSVWFAFSKQTKFYILLKHKRILGCAPAESNTARAYTTSILCHRVCNFLNLSDFIDLICSDEVDELLMD